jgi:hypothetical protein
MEFVDTSIAAAWILPDERAAATVAHWRRSTADSHL